MARGDGVKLSSEQVPGERPCPLCGVGIAGSCWHEMEPTDMTISAEDMEMVLKIICKKRT